MNKDNARKHLPRGGEKREKREKRERERERVGGGGIDR
jgi:hypothetical protein